MDGSELGLASSEAAGGKLIPLHRRDVPVKPEGAPGSPPLTPAVAPENNLPVQLTSFIGRDAEIADVTRLLKEYRVVTLTGAGGCGKTRLAAEVAAVLLQDHPDGVWWVDLAAVSTPALVSSAVATALSLREAPMQPLTDTITKHLKEQRALLLFDNCEHLVDACSALAETLLRSCRSLRILATSREPLGIEGEVAFRVPSLSLPEKEASRVESLDLFESSRLFMERARLARPNFRLTDDIGRAVAEICRRLDGIPLAIELAAARTRLLSPEQILDGLTDGLRLLTGGARSALPRQQTLRASMDWSHALLLEEERTLLRRLSVFAGGFTLDAAEDVCSGDGLERFGVLDLLSGLVDKSLVQVEDGDGEVRYRLLETIRQYEREKLTHAGESEVVRTRHLDFFTALAERAEPELEGGDIFDWLDLLDLELDNLRAAMDWAAASGQAEKGVRLGSSITVFWTARGRWTEPRTWYEGLLAEGNLDLHWRGRALLGAAQCTFTLDVPAARALGEKALEVGRELGDDRIIARALHGLGFVAFLAGDLQGGRPLLDESIRVGREANDALVISEALVILGFGEFMQGNPGRGRPLLEEALAVARRAGYTPGIASAIVQLGWAVVQLGDFDEAAALFEEGVALCERLGSPPVRSMGVAGLGYIATLRGAYPEAESLLQKALALDRRSGNINGLTQSLLLLGVLHWARGDLDSGVEHAEDGLRIARGMGIASNTVLVLVVLSWVTAWRGDLERAGSLIEEAASIVGELDSPWLQGFVLHVKGWLARERGEIDRAESLDHEALALLAEAGDKAWIVIALEDVAGLAARQASLEEAVRLFGAAQALRDRLGYARLASAQARYDGDVALAREGLTEEAYEKAWAEGADLSLEEAIAYAQRGRGERKRPVSGWASLTPTELEVSRLVGERLTNPQIAERLFVSRGTVKAHLSHIYSKLGISSRMELADEVARHDS